MWSINTLPESFRFYFSIEIDLNNCLWLCRPKTTTRIFFSNDKCGCPMLILSWLFAWITVTDDPDTCIPKCLTP